MYHHERHLKIKSREPRAESREFLVATLSVSIILFGSRAQRPRLSVLLCEQQILSLKASYILNDPKDILLPFLLNSFYPNLISVKTAE